MSEHNYSAWWGSPEPCPALYIAATAPVNEEAKEPFVKDLIAALDTGAPLTALPTKYKQKAKLHPAAPVKIKWAGYPEERVPAFLAEVSVDEYAPRLVQIIFSDRLDQYALIGRNLMRHWHMILKGPEQILEIRE